MTAPTPTAQQEAWRTVNETLGDTTSALETVRRLAALGAGEEDRLTALLFHDAIYRIVDALISRVDDAHTAASRVRQPS